jgi:hypothetical protein
MPLRRTGIGVIRHGGHVHAREDFAVRRGFVRALLVIVFDRDFEGITALPLKRDAILIADANAVSSSHEVEANLSAATCWQRRAAPRNPERS